MRFRSDSPCSRLSSAFPGRSLNSEREVNVSKSSLAIVVMRASSCEVYEIQNAERIEFYKKNCGTCSPFRVHNPRTVQRGTRFRALRNFATHSADIEQSNFECKPIFELIQSVFKGRKKFNWMHFRMHTAVVASFDHRFVAI